MSDIDRVRQMADEGRITEEEADQLIAVLREVEAAEANLEAAGSAGSSAPQAEQTSPRTEPLPPAQPPAAAPPDRPLEDPPARPETPPHRPLEAPPVGPHTAAYEAARDAAREAAREAREAAREATRQARDATREAARETRDAVRQAAREARGAAREASREAANYARETGRDVKDAVSGLGRLEVGDIGERPDKAIAPAGTPWVIVEMIGGDLDVTVDPSLEGPTAEGGPGNIEIEREAEGYKVKFMPDRGNFIDRFLSSVRSGDLSIRIPPHYGLALQATAGDVDLHGVRYLRGRLRAGDVSADVLHGVDFALMAGEFEATLDLREGDHVLTVGAGEAQVSLPADADVAVTGRVSIGDLDSHLPGLEERGLGLGGEVAGTIGAGTASLRLRVTTGDLTIRQAQPRGPEHG